MKQTAEYLRPFVTGDKQGMYDIGYQEGLEWGRKRLGYPDGPSGTTFTEWGRGFTEGYQAAEKEIQVVCHAGITD